MSTSQPLLATSSSGESALRSGVVRGVVLDSFHWHASNGTRNEIEHLDYHEVVGVHINDAVAGRALHEQIDDEREMVSATGVIDIAGFLQSLETIGYPGPLTVKPCNSTVRSMSPDAAAATASAALDRVLLPLKVSPPKQ